MKCPKCKNNALVKETRSKGAITYRRLQCPAGIYCGYKFTTYEVVAEELLHMINLAVRESDVAGLLKATFVKLMREVGDIK